MAVHIPDMKIAIAKGELPGKFIDDRQTFDFNRLAYVDSRGSIHYWTVRVRLFDDTTGMPVPITDRMLAQPVPALPGHRAEILVESSQAGGKVREVVPTYITAGKNLGKKNATNAITQALRDALGMYNKHHKRSDIIEAPAETKDAADDTANGAANGAADDAADAADADGADDDAAAPEAKDGFDEMPPPMLVKKIGETRGATLTPAVFAAGATEQPKLDGMHFVSYFKQEKGGLNCICYSRTGVRLTGQKQVVAEMMSLADRVPPVTPGTYGVAAASSSAVLDAYGAIPGTPNFGNPRPYFTGELYLHGKPLAWIVGQARRGDNENKLEFHIFDVVFPWAKAAGHDMESRHRQAYIDAFFAAAGDRPHPHVKRVPNTPVHSMDEATALAKQFLKEGYEGAIVRKDSAGYQYGYGNFHSDGLVKIKPKFDDEFPVVGFTQGARGKDVGAVIWECEVPNAVSKADSRFTVVPNMPLEKRKALFLCLSQMVEGPAGKSMTRFERDVKGAPLTVEYAGLSVKTNKPLQPKAVAFRTYEQGSEIDPILKLFKDCKI